MQDLVAFYKDAFNLHNAQFSRIAHDDTIVAIVYRVTTHDGTPLILKISPRAHQHQRELYFLRYFADKLPVPRVIAAVDQTSNTYGAILMECLPGQLLDIKHCSSGIAKSMGELFARIHTQRSRGYGDLICPQNLSAGARDIFINKFQDDVRGCTGHIAVPILEQCMLYLEKNSYLLDEVDGPCIVHYDYRPGNILVHDGTISGIIDWASARSGFAQEDFCVMEHWTWSQDDSTKKLFLEGYAQIRPVPDYKDIMPLLRLYKSLAYVRFIAHNGTWNDGGANESKYLFNKRFIETFFSL